MSNKFVLKHALADLGCSYLGSVGQSAKMTKSLEKGTMTYSLYLAPATLAGKLPNGKTINVCPNSKYCKDFCLNGSGQTKVEGLSGKSTIISARIKKTRFFYLQRAKFMQILLHELRREMKKAERLEFDFSVRLNCTSDLSPELFIDPESGKNVLELFPNVQFYDYTKCAGRFKLAKKYPNYNLTFSYDGHNWDDCERYLQDGGNVAVVFYDGLPKTFHGYKVIDGNSDDIRYKDMPKTIVGLHYHTTKNDYVLENGKWVYHEPMTPFIIKRNDKYTVWG